jgi:PTH1 family peptidyl-tRNA hydrolase
MKLIVGLGNPGRKYEGTRHNVGFAVLAELARKNATGKAREAFEGEVVDATLQGERAVLLCPWTFMNRSGTSVLRARDFYKISNEDLLVICDDFNLPLAKLRVRPQGSSGGQKGLADIIRLLGTEEFPRLRIGVGPVPEGWDGADFVLGKFTKPQLPEIEPAIWRAADAAEVWSGQGIQDCMNRYN